MSEKRLYRNSRLGVVVGVLYGIANRFDWDPAIVRMVFCTATLLTGGFPGVILYYIAFFCMTEDPHEYERNRALNSLRGMIRK